MKKSEAIKLIVDTMEANQYSNLEEWACYILEALEDADMLPPKNLNKYENYPTVTPTGNFDYSFAREWEDEV